MTSSQIRLRLLKQIEQLSSSSLKELYGVFLNYVNSGKRIDQWALLSDAVKTAIEEGLEQLDKKQRISRREAMNKLKGRNRR